MPERRSRPSIARGTASEARSRGVPVRSTMQHLALQPALGESVRPGLDRPGETDRRRRSTVTTKTQPAPRRPIRASGSWPSLACWRFRRTFSEPSDLVSQRRTGRPTGTWATPSAIRRTIGPARPRGVGRTRFGEAFLCGVRPFRRQRNGDAIGTPANGSSGCGSLRGSAAHRLDMDAVWRATRGAGGHGRTRAPDLPHGEPPGPDRGPGADRRSKRRPPRRRGGRPGWRRAGRS